jgi:hypothetical protein
MTSFWWWCLKDRCLYLVKVWILLKTQDCGCVWCERTKRKWWALLSRATFNVLGGRTFKERGGHFYIGHSGGSSETSISDYSPTTSRNERTSNSGTVQLLYGYGHEAAAAEKIRRGSATPYCNYVVLSKVRIINNVAMETTMLYHTLPVRYRQDGSKGTECTFLLSYL